MSNYSHDESKSAHIAFCHAEIKVRAEKRAGEMLREIGLSSGRPEKSSHDVRIKLNDLGISYRQSSRWQMMAGIPRFSTTYRTIVSIQAVKPGHRGNFPSKSLHNFIEMGLQ